MAPLCWCAISALALLNLIPSVSRWFTVASYAIVDLRWWWIGFVLAWTAWRLDARLNGAMPERDRTSGYAAGDAPLAAGSAAGRIGRGVVGRWHADRALEWRSHRRRAQVPAVLRELVSGPGLRSRADQTDGGAARRLPSTPPAQRRAARRGRSRRVTKHGRRRRAIRPRSLAAVQSSAAQRRRLRRGQGWRHLPDAQSRHLGVDLPGVPRGQAVRPDCSRLERAVARTPAGGQRADARHLRRVDGPDLPLPAQVRRVAKASPGSRRSPARSPFPPRLFRSSPTPSWSRDSW